MIRVSDGAVHVDAQGWHDLTLGAASERASVEQIPGMALALGAVAAPVARLHLNLVTPGGPFVHLAWIARDAVALLRATRGDERRLLALPPDHLPAALARLTGIGPRTGRDLSSRSVDSSALDVWFGADHARAMEALAEVGADRAWTLGASAVGADPAATLLAAAVDGPAGPRLVTYEEDGLVLQPQSPTAIWRLFAGLLPALAEAALTP